MFFPERTPLGQVIVYERETGTKVVRWPVDAVGMVKSGEYSTIPPGGPEESFDVEKTHALAPDRHAHIPNRFETVDEINGLKHRVVTTICSVCEEEIEPPVVTPIEHSPGVPLVATPATEAGPAQPVKLPGGR